MSDIPLGTLIGALVVLVLISAFFSAAEIGMVSLNRHRLRHLAESGHRGAILARKLLERPDRLIGVILLGSNFVNALASALATVTALRLLGEGEGVIAIVTILITLVVLIFTDLAPKTLAALYPERVAFPAAYVLAALLKLIYPIVWFINLFANGVLRLFGVSVKARRPERVTIEELKAIVLEASALMPETHHDMLVGILDLEDISVEDVMVPRGKLDGVDLDADWDDIVTRLTGSTHTRLPAYRGSIDNLLGILHVRRVLNLVHGDRLNRDSLEQALVEPYYVPLGTPLTKQLINFKKIRRNTGIVVDEYGDIHGMVTLDDILEEIIGDFRPLTATSQDDLHAETDGSYLVKGAMPVRDLNRRLDWELPIGSSRTVNGLIVEYLEDIPKPGVSLMIDGYSIEVLRVRGTGVETARIKPVHPAA